AERNLRVAPGSTEALREVSQAIREQAVTEELLWEVRRQASKEDGGGPAATERLKLLGSLAQFLAPPKPSASSPSPAAHDNNNNIDNNNSNNHSNNNNNHNHSSEPRARYSTDYSRFAQTNLGDSESEAEDDGKGADPDLAAAAKAQRSLLDVEARLAEALESPNHTDGEAVARLQSLRDRMLRLRALGTHAWGEAPSASPEGSLPFSLDALD
ncbi:unnamed protein product, partial [Polarella glacialis]